MSVGGEGDRTERRVGEKGQRLWPGGLHGGEFGKSMGELEEEVGRGRQATAKKLEESMERARTAQLSQHSGSQGGGQGYW